MSSQSHEQTIALLEKQLWNGQYKPSKLALYQESCRALEQQYAEQNNDLRHHFVVVIPVADRPQHLQTCLDSLLDLCELYQYGGKHEENFSKVSVLIVDDSKGTDAILQNQKLVEYVNSKGVTTWYLGQKEQRKLLADLPKKLLASVCRITGSADRPHFFHKGASITRNIAYLQLNKLAQTISNPLFLFMDSDQEFKVKIQTESSHIDITAINYFYHLDRIFRGSNIKVLTGKVVGDPPVSPAVMAKNFLQDVISFLDALAKLNPTQACSFHNQNTESSDDAAYHDMADLFGFESSKASFQYHCTLQGEHDHASCLSEFSSHLDEFFDGEHPTRKTYFEYQHPADSITPARTVYTGNYVLNRFGLKYFIPYATLKLRMAGPTLGRLVKAELGAEFVSANLPMLHKRTVADHGTSEFRPGINRTEQKIDLSAEFERQYYGDVMLFTIETLTQAGYPGTQLSAEYIKQTLNSTEEKLHQQYSQKHNETLKKIDQLKQFFYAEKHWWRSHDAESITLNNIQRFIENMQHNFGKKSLGFALISSHDHRLQRLNEIHDAISLYPDDISAWENIK